MAIRIMIPARLNSRRFPRKALQDIPVNGKVVPLIVRAYQMACSFQQQGLVDSVHVVTDSIEIQNALFDHRGGVSVLCQEGCNGSDRISHALNAIDLFTEKDTIINIQGDIAYYNPDIVKRLIAFACNRDFQVLTPVVPMGIATFLRMKDTTSNGYFNNDPDAVSVVTDKRMNALYFSRATLPGRREDHGYNVDTPTPLTLYKHIGMYAYKGDIIAGYKDMRQSNAELVENLEQLRLLYNGIQIKCIPVKQDVLAIDHEDDVKKVFNFYNYHGDDL